MIITKEMIYTNRIKMVLDRYKETMEIDLEGDALYEHIWENKNVFAELMLEDISDFGMDFEIFNSKRGE